MKLIKKILQRLNGYEYPQEYLCLENGKLPDPLHVYIVKEEKVICDVSNLHLFVGYHPLIFAFPTSEMIDLSRASELDLIFSNSILTPGSAISAQEVVARLTLLLEVIKEINQSKIYFFQGTNGQHKFLSPLSQWAIQMQNEWFQKKPGNVFLHANLYRQVQIAYAIPRGISLISIKQDQAFNLFPTDLNGKLNDHIYIISLRQGGMAAKQVESTKQIVLSQVNPSFYKVAYGLGKNHMQPTKSIEAFPFSHQVSEKFGIPLPDESTGYYELTLTDSFLLGIHQLFIFSITTNRANSGLNSLTHIHNAYASWRKKKGLKGNYLLR